MRFLPFPTARRSFPVALVVGAAALLGVSTHAPAAASGAGASRLPPVATPRVHPEAVTLFAHLARTGQTLPTFRRSEDFERTRRLPVIVRFLAAPDANKRESLIRRGVTFERAEPIASGAWLATVTEEGLHALGADPDVLRVSVDLFRTGPRPDEQSLEETRASVAKHASIAKNGERLDGKGVVIADIDSPMYIHHPAFFRADGGAFAWIDVDGNKKLTPGTDGVDLDGSGTIEPGEVLHELRSTAISRGTNAPINERTSFEPDLDYLYLDTNGNGTRDHGKGFPEATPAYGEPLFVFDDANHDGVAQATERVLQLKTSKIRTFGSEDKTFTRGKNLNAYDPESDPRLAGSWGHATAVGGILVGGEPGLSRWVGLAPEAELIVNDSTGQRGPTTAVQWAIDQKANVILTEYAPYNGVSLDGSSESETILDAANARSIVTVSPAGNLAGGHKHRSITFAPGTQKLTLGTNVDAQLASVSLHYKGAERGLQLTLKTPSGTTIALPDDAPAGIDQPDGSIVYVMRQTTPRGTHERFVNLVSQSPLRRGFYELSVTLDAGAPLDVELFAADNVSSWAGGFSFDQDTPTRTICSPSTSDRTISVAAYVLHDEPEFNPAGPKGALARYSSRGPRMDGTPGIEIVAPDNPLSTAPPNKAIEGVAWSPFGGTSGAGPHVAAAVALLKQTFPKASADELKERLLVGTRPAAETDETTVGRGKLDIAKALGAKVLSGIAPQIKLEAVGDVVTGLDATLVVTATDDEALDGLTARWDLDYDGTFDTAWLPLGEQVVSLVDVPAGSKLAAKVEVRDGQGNVNGATVTLDVTAPAEPKAATAPAAADEGCGCNAAKRDPARFTLHATLGFALLAAARRRRARA